MKPLAILALALVLAGCTATPEAATTPAPSSSAVEAGPLLNAELQPKAISPLGEEEAEVEGARLADVIQATIGADNILGVADTSQLVPADDDISAYYAVRRTFTLAQTVDVLSLAEVLATLLEGSDWTRYDTSNENSVYQTALASGEGEGTWFAFITGNATVEGQATLELLIGSPDIT